MVSNAPTATPSTTEPPFGGQAESRERCGAVLTKQRACYEKHGLGDPSDPTAALSSSERFQRCWIPSLRAKRCLSFARCTSEALAYYSTPSDRGSEGGPSGKGYCSSYDEAYCFGNPRIMKVDLRDPTPGQKATQEHRMETFKHHERWKRRVVNSKLKQQRCEQVRNKLHACLREHG
ncbi:unnamed protein product [Pseudo-nitzschia multistriata]|uniref:Uncharacterized protein n=1 Tax=Pseudo-nitzschia multistriata TaxID=183589 RepID=A0A448ZR77_9STRA|nr:unnamed protein product [Pseudo-nitzschia multistriata]